MVFILGYLILLFQ